MKRMIFGLMIGFVLMFSIMNIVAAAESTVCCERTTSNLFCQDVPSSQCASGARQVPTACSSTSYCKPGVCYDSSEGICATNTPQLVCQANNGTWSATSPAACNLGCCVLGDQASFVSLVRCKKLAGSLGLQTNFRNDITDELSCVLSVQNQDKGACVYESDFQTTCKVSTRADCVGTSGFGGNLSSSNAQFYKDKLCSAPELGTNCGKTKKTTCLPGKEEVYFVDSCGNPANIYDASKIEDNEYWTNMKDKTEVCSPGLSNANSASCGNCNYLEGSFCRSTDTAGGSRATYGDYICADLNCKNTDNGKSYKHGESWCVYDDKGPKDDSNNAVGSRFFRHICNNGQELVEPCADFRQEECIEDNIAGSTGAFSQAACRVNRWQDCTVQSEQLDCENTDKRDCVWKPGAQIGNVTGNGGACLPKISPGLKFWEDTGDSKTVCAQGNAFCVVTFEKGLFGGEKCKTNCECLADGWMKQREDVCLSLGDCGPKINWLGQQGFKDGYKKTLTDQNTNSSS